MTIQPLGAIVVTVGGVWTVLAHTTASSVSPTTLAGGALSNSTRYWVYAYNSAGTLTFVADTTGPDVGLRYKNADTDKQYVSTFYVDSAGNVLPFEQSDSYYAYQVVADTGNRVLNAGNATALTTVALNASVPTQAACVLLVGITNVTAAGRRAYIYSSTGTPNGFSVADDGTTSGQGQGSVALANGFTFDYQVSNAATTLTVYSTGFWL